RPPSERSGTAPPPPPRTAASLPPPASGSCAWCIGDFPGPPARERTPGGNPLPLAGPPAPGSAAPARRSCPDTSCSPAPPAAPVRHRQRERQADVAKPDHSHRRLRGGEALLQVVRRGHGRVSCVLAKG